MTRKQTRPLLLTVQRWPSSAALPRAKMESRILLRPFPAQRLPPELFRDPSLRKDCLRRSDIAFRRGSALPLPLLASWIPDFARNHPLRQRTLQRSPLFRLLRSASGGKRSVASAGERAAAACRAVHLHGTDEAVPSNNPSKSRQLRAEKRAHFSPCSPGAGSGKKAAVIPHFPDRSAGGDRMRRNYSVFNCGIIPRQLIRSRTCSPSGLWSTSWLASPFRSR